MPERSECSAVRSSTSIGPKRSKRSSVPPWPLTRAARFGAPTVCEERSAASGIAGGERLRRAAARRPSARANGRWRDSRPRLDGTRDRPLGPSRRRARRPGSVRSLGLRPAGPPRNPRGDRPARNRREEHVRPGPPVEQVCPGAPEQEVVASSPQQFVVASPAADHVMPRRSEKNVGSPVAFESCTAERPRHGWPSRRMPWQWR